MAQPPALARLAGVTELCPNLNLSTSLPKRTDAVLLGMATINQDEPALVGTVPDLDKAYQKAFGTSIAAMATAMSRQIQASRRQLSVLSGSAALKSADGYLLQRRKSLQILQNRLLSAENQNIHRSKQRYIALTAKLDAMSPLKVLTRGYAMTQDEEGNLVRSVGQVAVGEKLTVSLADGTIRATIAEIKENCHESAK